MLEMLKEERRNSSRVPAYRPVRLQQCGTSQIIETLTKDIALGGLRCVSHILLPVSTEVGVDLSLSSGGEPLSARGKTTWFRIIPGSEQFDVGIEFIDLSLKNKIRLSAYIDMLSSRVELSEFK